MELKAERNRGLRELAQQPLLLALLCLAFNDSLTFSPRRVEIYHEALDALLRKWDSSRNIVRSPIYEQLSVDRKHHLFAFLAAQTFAEGKYFIPQDTLEAYIRSYLKHLPNIAEPIPDAQTVLQTIEAYHGILVELTHRIHAFAHFSFQEYYAARYAVENALEGTLPDMLVHAHENRWREVILLTASMFPNADAFFKVFLTVLQNWLKDDPQLIEFLNWVARKASNLKTSYKYAALRAYYAGISRLYVRDFRLAISLDYALNQVIDHASALALALIHNPEPYLTRLFEQVDIEDFTLALDLAFDRAITYALNHEHALVLDSAIAQTIGLTELQVELRTLITPKVDDQPTLWQTFANGLRTIMIKHRDISYDWDFTAKQAKTLEDYFAATQLLVDCLDVAYVTDRAAIEERLLLPPDT